MTQKLKISIREKKTTTIHIRDFEATEMMYKEYVLKDHFLRDVCRYHIDTLRKGTSLGEWLVDTESTNIRPATEKEIVAYYYRELSQFYETTSLYGVFNSKDLTGILDGKEIVLEVVDE